MTTEVDPLFHIAEPSAWSTAQTIGEYRAASLGTEGFIHCSFREQVSSTAQRYYAGRRDLWLLEIDPAGLPVAIERSTGDELFPHVYGPIPLAAVRSSRRFGPSDEAVEPAGANGARHDP